MCRSSPNRPLAASLRLCLLAFLVVVAGCAWGPATYYRAQRTYLPRHSPVRITSLPEAAPILREARVAAFIAPDGCQRGAGGKSQRTAGLQLRCAALMAELEGRAVQLGFRVVGWRGIRDASDPVATAREAGADLVLRLGEKTTRFDPRVGLTNGPVEYSARMVSPRGGQAPLALSEPVAMMARCDPQFRALRAREMAAVELSVEAIDPAGLRPIWRLSRTFAEHEAVDGRFRAEHGTRVRARRAYPTAPGAALLVCGLAAMGPALFTDLNEFSSGFMISGVSISLGAVVAMFLTPHTIDTWPDAESTMCTVDNAHWMPPTQQPRALKAWQLRTFADEVFGHLALAGRIAVRP